MVDFQLAIPDEQCYLEELLAKYFDGEKVELKCDNCEEGRNAVKNLDCYRMLQVITIQLMRMKYSPETQQMKKISTLVSFPMKNLNILPYVCDTEKKALSTKENRTYDLFAVVNHFGQSLNQGHYIGEFGIGSVSFLYWFFSSFCSLLSE